MDLQRLILYLTKKNNMMINFHDTSGVLTLDKLKLDTKFKMHSKKFCDIAKTTHSGYRLCTRAKSIACKKAVVSGRHFFGTCPYGLFELVYPVITQGKTVCILFIGNFLPSKKLSEKKIDRACFVTGVKRPLLNLQLKNTEPKDEEFMLDTARIIESFILSVLKEERLPLKPLPGQHWAISEIELYLSTHFRQKITLKEVAKLYFLNEKYAGRLFLKQTGKTFNSYLSDLRLSSATELLKSTEKSVIDIAFESGFNSISYFNRIFMERFGKSPTAYRRDFK